MLLAHGPGGSRFAKYHDYRFMFVDERLFRRRCDDRERPKPTQRQSEMLGAFKYIFGNFKIGILIFVTSLFMLET